jgi:asparagine N-glycosylation enzyme membrane subunit Stt3
MSGVTAKNGHNLQGVDDVAHQALDLATKLQKEMNKNPLQTMLDKSRENSSWFVLFFSGIMMFIMLTLATTRLYKNQYTLGSSGITWEIYTYMILTTVFLGLYVIFAQNIMVLGNYIINYALFFATLAFAIGTFMTIVAIRTRMLPK